jgi:phage terminase large subunit
MPPKKRKKKKISKKTKLNKTKENMSQQILFRIKEKTIPTTRLFSENLKSEFRTIVNIGGARSSKSHSLAQVFIHKLLTEHGKNFAIGRKTFPALRMSAYRLFTTLLKEYDIYSTSNHNRTENWYEHNGNRVQFFSLDNPEKIKSTEFNYIWLEEANEFTFEDYITLLTRLSGSNTKVTYNRKGEPIIQKDTISKNSGNKMYLSLNPVDIHGWIPKKLLSMDNIEVIKSTYKDNPFIPEEYKEVLEGLKEQDENSYRVYALGEWGTVKDIIYSNYDFADGIPSKCDETIYGLDFGFNNPTALVKVYVCDGQPYVQEKIYDSGLTNGKLIEVMKTLSISKKDVIYADSAEPDRIKEIYNAGFNVKPAEKSVRNGIDMVQRFRLKLLKDSPNLKAEIESYKWKSDKDKNVLDEPVGYNDHAMDALRYAIYTHFKNPPVKLSAQSFKFGIKRAGLEF